MKHHCEGLKHDQRALADVSLETPFICVTCRCGTDLSILRPVPDPHLPPMDQRVPFPFGKVGYEQEERRWFNH